MINGLLANITYRDRKRDEWNTRSNSTHVSCRRRALLPGRGIGPNVSLVTTPVDRPFWHLLPSAICCQTPRFGHDDALPHLMFGRPVDNKFPVCPALRHKGGRIGNRNRIEGRLESDLVR